MPLITVFMQIAVCSTAAYTFGILGALTGQTALLIFSTAGLIHALPAIWMAIDVIERIETGTD